VTASFGAVATGFLAYAIYFDHRRRTDASFRRGLKRESKQVQKSNKAKAEASAANLRVDIRKAVDDIGKEPQGKSPEEIEQTFLQELTMAEKLSSDESEALEAAKSYYRALKVYPNKAELIQLYERSVPKPILDILAEMIALDETLITSSIGGSSASGLMMDEVS